MILEKLREGLFFFCCSVSFNFFCEHFNWTKTKWTKKKENLGDGLPLRSKSSFEKPLIKVVAQQEEEYMDLLCFRSGIELILQERGSLKQKTIQKRKTSPFSCFPNYGTFVEDVDLDIGPCHGFIGISQGPKTRLSISRQGFSLRFNQ